MIQKNGNLYDPKFGNLYDPKIGKTKWIATGQKGPERAREAIAKQSARALRGHARRG